MASLVYTDGDAVEYSFTIGSEPVLVGRAPECAIRSNHPLVSRNHARFYVDGAGTLYIEDLGSANGVYVGQQRVSHSAVPVGEIVVVGSLTFRQMPDYGQPADGYPPGDPYGQPPNDPYGQPGYPPPPANAFAPQPGDISTQPASQAYSQPPYAPAAADMSPPDIAPPLGPPPGMPPSFAPPEMPPPMVAPEAPAMPPSMGPPAMPPPIGAPAMPPPAAPVFGAADLAVAHLLEIERKARVVAEEERDAYGARMAELHGELRALRQQLEQQGPTPDASGKVSGAELESYRARLADADERVKATESRLKSTEDELTAARAVLLQSEERIVAEMAASEKREEHIAALTRKIAELEQLLAQARGVF